MGPYFFRHKVMNQVEFLFRNYPFIYTSLISCDGDFITAPKISILFSEIIAIWCIAFWKKLKCPEKINIVELGPGDGSLSLGLIKTFKNFKKFHKSYNLKLLEKSTYLIQVQKKKIISDKVNG